MAIKLAELLNYVLQLDAGDRQQAQLDLQTQQSHLGNLQQFISVLGRVQDPQQLTELKGFFSQNGVPSSTLDQVARAYIPTMAQLQESLVAQGLSAMPESQRAATANEAASTRSTGMNAAGVKESQETAAAYNDPSIYGTDQKKANLWGRINYDPGKFAMSQAVAGLGQGELRQQARVGGGTAVSANTMAQLTANRDQFQTQAQLALDQFNRGVFESDRNYDLSMGTQAFDQQYKTGVLGIRGAKGAGSTGEADALEEIRKTMESAQKANSPAARRLFQQMIERQAKSMTDDKGKPIFQLQPGSYTPGFYDKHFR